MKVIKRASVTVSLLAASALAPSMAYAEKPVELSATELANYQSKSYALPAKVGFGATIAALQTMGYVDIQSNRDAGTISGTTEAKAKAFYNIVWGFGKKKMTQKASLLVEENGPNGSLIRLNLHVNEMKARGIFGTSFSDGKLVRVAQPYADFWTILDAEVARRTPTAVTSLAPPVSVAPVTPIVPAPIPIAQ